MLARQSDPRAAGEPHRTSRCRSARTYEDNKKSVKIKGSRIKPGKRLYLGCVVEWGRPTYVPLIKRRKVRGIKFERWIDISRSCNLLLIILNYNGAAKSEVEIHLAVNARVECVALAGRKF